MAFPFEVDSTTDVPLWVQLRKRLIRLIETGYFKPGDKLPTVRGLASEISINYNTVNKAYLSLVSDGYLESTRGRGVFVRDIAMGEARDAGGADQLIDDCISACRELGLTLDEIQQCMTRRINHVKMKEDRAQRVASGDVGRIVAFESETADGADSRAEARG